MSDAHRHRLINRGLNDLLIAAGPQRLRNILWSTLILLGIPVGMLGFLSILFWVYGVES